MKKTYMAPIAEKLSFRYRDQVVASSNSSLVGCTQYHRVTGKEDLNVNGCYCMGEEYHYWSGHGDC